MGTPLLYIITILIWGTTWIAITYQLGATAPTTSVALRFGLASVVLVLWCVVTRVSLRLTGRQHLRAAAQGVCLFGTNLWLLYLAERSIPSGVVSVLFTLLVPMNIVGGRLVYGTPIAPRTALGAVFGLAGVALVFWPQFGTVGSAGASLAGLAYAILGTASASVGNLISVRNLRDGMPILQTNAFGMAYGALAMAAVGLVTGQSFHVAWNPPYLLSLGYLAIFGSIFAFGAYITLIRRIGAGRAAYTGVLYPLVALGISTAWEGYHWTLGALAGMAFCVTGSLVMNRR